MPQGLIVTPKFSPVYLGEVPRLKMQLLKAAQDLKHYKDLKQYRLDVYQRLLNSAGRVSYSGYVIGAKQVSTNLDNGLSIKLRKEIESRAKQASVWLAGTSGRNLKIAAAAKLRAKWALSSDRALDDALNELSLAFYWGLNMGWSLNPRARKSWFVSSAHDKDDMCDDNEDDGAIAINRPFTSGHMFPPAHIGCNCNLILTGV